MTIQWLLSRQLNKSRSQLTHVERESWTESCCERAVRGATVTEMQIRALYSSQSQDVSTPPSCHVDGWDTNTFHIFIQREFPYLIRCCISYTEIPFMEAQLNVFSFPWIHLIRSWNGLLSSCTSATTFCALTRFGFIMSQRYSIVQSRHIITC